VTARPPSGGLFVGLHHDGAETDFLPELPDTSRITCGIVSNAGTVLARFFTKTFTSDSFGSALGQYRRVFATIFPSTVVNPQSSLFSTFSACDKSHMTAKSLICI
jgi:hypothetical protein